MNIYNPGPTPGGFPESFQTGLQQLLQMKMGQLQKKHENRELFKNYSEIFKGQNVPEDAVRAFAALPAQERQNMIKSGAWSMLQRQPQEQQGQMTNQGRFEPEIQQALQQQTQQPDMRQFLNQQAPDYSQNAMIQRSMNGEQFTPGQEMLQQQPQKFQQETAPEPIQDKTQQLQQFSQQTGIELPQVKKLEKVFSTATPKPKESFSKKDVFNIASQDPAARQASIMNNPFIPAQKKQLWLKNELDMQKNAQKHAYKIYETEHANIEKKYSKIKDIDEKTRAEVLDNGKNAADQEQRIRAQVALVNTGKLSHPWVSALLGTLEHGVGGASFHLIPGINLHGKESKESQLYDKYHSQNASAVAKQLGSRMTQNEYDAAMKKYPGLTQSDEAKINQFNAVWLDEVLPKKLEAQSAREILKENKGETPDRFKELIQSRVEPQLKLARDRFLNEGKGEFEYKVLPEYKPEDAYGTGYWR